ncbi:MAG: hypothetical protein ACYDBQ_08130 [Thermoplasmatota archaeon]
MGNHVRRLASWMAFLATGALALAANGVAQTDTSCPLNFTATAGGPGTVTFHWTGFGGADAYQVFGNEGQANTAGYSPYMNGNARDYTAQNLAPGNYTFWVTAFHSGTVVASSCHRDATISAGPAAPCPLGVTATPIAGHVALRWDAVNGSTGYRVARAVDGGSFAYDYQDLAPSSQPNFTDLATTNGHSYSYLVSTQNTRLPPNACTPVSITMASVPFFPGVLPLGLAAVGMLFGLLVIRRR